ncbi:MAG: isochorismatase family protein [Muribaculaceae bacterium]
MKKLLILIDCQNDFITGSLAVKGAPEAMDALAGYIKAHGNEYADIVATLDWHPKRHTSFAAVGEGGLWPAHCVQHTVGAALHDGIAQACEQEIKCFTKGNLQSRDEYSIFANEQNGPRLAKMIADGGYDRIDVCGLCGDYCVKESVQGLIDHGFGSKVNILLAYTPSIDGGAALQAFVAANSLATQE